jgi:hypothetical protein
MSDNRPRVYAEGTDWIYRASSLGSCTRSLLFARRGLEPLPPPAWLQEKFNQGHAMEDTLMTRFADDHNTTVDGEQLEIELRCSPHTVVRGHIDGLARINNKRIVVDAKFVGETLWNKLRNDGITSVVHYAWQTSVYCHALEAEEWCLALGLKNGDGEFTGDMHYMFGTPTFTRDDIIARVVEIEAYVGSEILPACPTPADYPCPFYYLHDDDDTVVELTGIESDHLHQTWDTYKKARELEDQAKKLKADATRLAKETFVKFGPRVKTDRVQMTWVDEQEVPEQTVTRKAYTKQGYARWKNLD